MADYGQLRGKGESGKLNFVIYHPLYRSLRGEWEPTRFAGQLKTLSRKWRVSRYAKTFGEIFLTDYCSP